jgi:hypothetical protein
VLAQQLKRSTNIQARRRLAELYARGQEVRFGPEGKRASEEPPDADDVVVWVQPPSPLQRDMAIREAQAARSRVTLGARDTTSVEAQSARSFVYEIKDDDLVEYCLALGESERQNEARRRVLSREEWKDIDSMRDAVRQWSEAGFPEGPEWDGLREKDRAFGAAVQVELDDIEAIDKETLQSMNRSFLEKKAFDRRIEIMGTAEFMRMYELWMLYFACRDPEDHAELFFERPEEIREYPDFVGEALLEVMNEFITESSDAKN